MVANNKGDRPALLLYSKGEEESFFFLYITTFQLPTPHCTTTAGISSYPRVTTPIINHFPLIMIHCIIVPRTVSFKICIVSQHSLYLIVSSSFLHYFLSIWTSLMLYRHLELFIMLSLYTHVRISLCLHHTLSSAGLKLIVVSFLSLYRTMHRSEALQIVIMLFFLRFIITSLYLTFPASHQTSFILYHHTSSGSELTRGTPLYDLLKRNYSSCFSPWLTCVSWHLIIPWALPHHTSPSPHHTLRATSYLTHHLIIHWTLYHHTSPITSSYLEHYLILPHPPPHHTSPTTSSGPS